MPEAPTLASIAVGATTRAPVGMVAAADHLAASAGVAVLRDGGSAADAAVAAGAVLAVTNQHQCGLGGDLFALVHRRGEPVAALCAAGRAGSGVDADRARAEGIRRLPFHGDIRAVTVPGCVDGWVALHGRYGRLPLARALEAAVAYAAHGFPASRLLAYSAPAILPVIGADDYLAATDARGRLPVGALVRRPGVAAALEAVASDGRDAFYAGPFGAGLVALGRGQFTGDDLARPQAEWVTPLRVTAWGHDVWTTPPPSQGYLTLAGAWIAEGLPLPDDTAHVGLWPHLLVEAARVAGADREAVLFDGADGAALLAPERLGPRRAAIDLDRRGGQASLASAGGTTVCCAVDGDRTGVTLIQSNASAWGAHIVEPATRVFLHDRGIGFSLEPGHPAELAAGRRPPHTLAPALVTLPDGSLRAVLGTMGGDSQPQVVLQLLARLLHHGESPGRAVAAPRWVLGGAGSFRTWDDEGPGHVVIEAHADDAWSAGLAARGHDVRRSPGPVDHGFGHAQVIEAVGDTLAGVADPRALDGAAIGY